MRSTKTVVLLNVLVAAAAAMPAFGQTPTGKWLVGPGDVVRGTLSSGDAILAEDDTYYDAYVLPVSAGVRYTFRLDSDDFDTYLIVSNHITGKTTQDDDGGTGANSLLNLTAEDNGFVLIVVNSYKEGSGAYTLRIE